MLEEVRILHVHKGVAVQRTDCVVKEAEVCLKFLSGDDVVCDFRVHCIPSLLRELALGFLICEGISYSVKDVHVRRLPSNLKLNTKTAKSTAATATADGYEENEFVSESYEVIADLMADDAVRQVTSCVGRRDLRIGYDDVFSLVRKLEECGTMHRKTGCTHVVGVFESASRDYADVCDCVDVRIKALSGGNVMRYNIKSGRCVIVEDVSRHCAIDKAVGLCIENGISTDECVLVTSCRQTFSTMRKAANAGFPVVVSVSAPTSEAIRIAEMSGITLIGFARGRRFNIYANAWRLDPTLVRV